MKKKAAVYNKIVKKRSSLREFIAKDLAVSRNKAKEIIDTRNVFVNQKRVWIASHTVSKNDVVEIIPFDSVLKLIGRVQPDEKERVITRRMVLYEDDYIIVLNKPAGIVSENAKGSLEDELRIARKDKNIRALHRLDRDTTGVLFFAKNEESRQLFCEQWEKMEVSKVYDVILHGTVKFKTKEIRRPVDNKSAVSFFTLVQTANDYSYIEARIITGRMHQIRQHASMIGHPVVGDKQYGFKKMGPETKRIKRQLLHSRKLTMIHPVTGAELTIEAPLPGDFFRFAKSHKLLTIL